MNWAGRFAQKHTEATDTVLDLGCGVMQATMNFVPTYDPNKLNCHDLLGVDIFPPYLQFLRSENIPVLKCDLTVKSLPFKDKSFDVVLLLDILEHLSLEQAQNLEKEAARIAKKKIVIITPTVFFSNEQAVTYDEGVYKGKGANEYQRHQCYISREWLKKNGYKVTTRKKRYWQAVKKTTLNILHIHDQAGVSCLLALYQRELGHKADILLREELTSEIPRMYGLTEKMMKRTFVQSESFVRRQYRKLPSGMQVLRMLREKIRTFHFLLRILIEARKYDVVHIHSVWTAVFFLPFKKKILQWHGDDCRSKPSFKSTVKRKIIKTFIRFYARISTMYVSTPDLLHEVPNSKWLPNPVDLNHFRKRRRAYKPKSAFYTHNWYETGEHAKKIANQLKLDLTVLERLRMEWISHKHFPAHLSQFEYFIDRKEIPSLSKTALESLSLGLKVVQGWDNKIVTKLDSKHSPEKCAERIMKIYREL